MSIKNFFSTKKSKKTSKKVKIHHRVKQSFYSKHPFFVPLFTIVFLFFGSIIGLIIFGGQVVKPSDARVVHFHVGNKNQSIPTRATTVKEFLERADIKYSESDIIEPSLDTPITTQEFSINIYKAKIVTIIDNKGKKTVTKTADTTPELIVAKAGYKVYPEDKITIVPASENLESGVLGVQIHVDQSTPIKLNLYGTNFDIRTTATTVAELAKERGIDYDENSIIPAPGTKLTENQSIFVAQPGKKLVSGEEIIPRNVDTIQDSNLEAGKTEVRTEGSDGKKAIIYELVDGTNKKYLNEIIITQPVNKVIARGTKSPALPSNLNVSGDKIALMSAAGISPGEYGAADYIISRESGWRPGAGNASSGAYGLCQALPASKMSSAGGDYLTNPVTQLKWCTGYAVGRYGGWSGAYNFWIVNHWW